MLTEIHPKLPMRNKDITRKFYITLLGFKELGQEDYEGYLMLGKDKIQIHFFEYGGLVPESNYGMVYIRLEDIDRYYNSLLASNVAIHPNGPLENKPWRQREFSILDPDMNLLTFGQEL